MSDRMSLRIYPRILVNVVVLQGHHLHFVWRHNNFRLNSRIAYYIKIYLKLYNNVYKKHGQRIKKSQSITLIMKQQRSEFVYYKKYP